MARYDRGDRGDRGGRDGRQLDCKVYVGDLPRDATEKDIERSFSYYGPIRSVWVARNPPGRTADLAKLSFAFVEYEDPRDAEDAVKGLDGSSVAGGRVRVEHSNGKIRPKPWNRGGGGGGGGRGPPRRRPFDSNDRCYECGEHGHYAYDCRNRRGGGGGGSSRRRSRSRSRSYEKRRSPSYSRSRSRSRGRDRRSYSR